MNMTIEVAKGDDLDQVLDLLNIAARWLKTQGTDQWGPGFDAARIGPMIERGEMLLVREGTDAIATCAVSPDGDTDFWTPEELAEPALYVAKIAIARDQAGHGLGALLVRWLGDRAARRGARWVRADAWRTNHDLHAYYTRTGWTYLRTVELPHRRSGALFQRPAVRDSEATAAFLSSALPSVNGDAAYAVGDRVVFEAEGVLARGDVVGVWSEWTAEMGVRPAPSYEILDDQGHRYDRGHHTVRRVGCGTRGESKS